MANLVDNIAKDNLGSIQDPRNLNTYIFRSKEDIFQLWTVFYQNIMVLKDESSLANPPKGGDAKLRSLTLQSSLMDCSGWQSGRTQRRRRFCAAFLSEKQASTVWGSVLRHREISARGQMDRSEIIRTNGDHLKQGENIRRQN
jgi:nitric oxide reductase activation protein